MKRNYKVPFRHFVKKCPKPLQLAIEELSFLAIDFYQVGTHEKFLC